MDDRDFVWWDFDELIASLEAQSSPGDVAGIARDGRSLEEALNDELRGLRDSVGELLDRARGASDDAWPDQREKLLVDFDSASDGIREAFDFLHQAIGAAQRDDGVDDEIRERIRSLRLSLQRALGTP